MLAQRAHLHIRDPRARCRPSHQLEGHWVKHKGPMSEENWRRRSRRNALIDQWLPEDLNHVDSSHLQQHASRAIEAAIDRSRSLYSLKDDWDDCGSPGYSRATWERAVGFLRLHASKFWLETGRAMPAPIIGPGPDGSIDLFWTKATFELLVNIPIDESAPATFYGEDYGRQTIEGTISTSEYRRGIHHWLTSQ